MNEEEAFFRRQLRRIRYLATSIGHSYLQHEIMFSRWPQTQAWEIVDQYSCYSLAAMMLVDSWLTPEKLESSKYLPSTGLPATKKEIYEDFCHLQAKHLKDRLNPLEVYSKVLMPLIKFELEKYERLTVNEGYRLPKWDRPKWLKEIEADPKEV